MTWGRGLGTALVLLTSTLSGCVSTPHRDPSPPIAPPVNVAWNNAIAAAKVDPTYAGTYVADNVLWLGFTRDAAAKLAAITTQPDIRAFTARHSAAELDKAFRSTVSLLEASRFGVTSANIDFKRNAVTVGTSYSLRDSGGPTPNCLSLTPLPETAPGSMVELVDIRDCKK